MGLVRGAWESARGTRREVGPFALLVLLLLCAPSRGLADDESEDAEATARADAIGRRLFLESAHFVRPPPAGAKAPASLYLDLHAVDLRREGRRLNGARLQVWWAKPHRLRQTLRETATQDLAAATTKVLDGQQAWVHSGGEKRRLHGTQEGAAAIAQLREDHEQMGLLLRFLAPISLDGEGVVWRYRGMQTVASGLRKGRWAVVSRLVEGEPTMHLHLTPYQDEEGQWRVGGPGVVVIDGDRAAERKTEIHVLSEWRRPGAPAGTAPAGHTPRVIASYEHEVGAPEPEKHWFRALPEVVLFDPQMRPGTFE